MSVDVATFGKGCILEIGDGATPTEVFTEIKGIGNMDFDEGGADPPEKLPITSQSTVGTVRELMDGLSNKRPGKLTFDLTYDALNAQHALLHTKSINGVSTHYKYTLLTKTTPFSKVASFSGRVGGFPISIPFDKQITVKAAISIDEESLTWA